MNRKLKKSKTNWEDKNNTGIRGPVCPEFMASFIVAIAGNTLERVFKKIISILAAKSNHCLIRNCIKKALEVQGEMI